MFRKAEEMIRETRSQMRGGQGEVELVHLFQAGEYKGKARLFVRITLQPGCSIGLHEHVGEEEIYTVIRGEAVLTDSTLPEEQIMRPGDASLTLSGESHAIRNNGRETLEMLALVLLNE
ncbi:MAG: cupin domain-containing protein [Ruminococcaceae bacterium]|jgi:quercetin dioxygenase-like cupin family protein|nr:cupin domain-containing protein [Oscillospiraceae bacterium]